MKLTQLDGTLNLRLFKSRVFLKAFLGTRIGITISMKELGKSYLLIYIHVRNAYFVIDIYPCDLVNHHQSCPSQHATQIEFLNT